MKRIGYLISFLLISASSHAQLVVNAASTSVCENDTVWFNATGFDSITWESSSAVLSADTGGSVYATGALGTHEVIVRGYNLGDSTVQDSTITNISFNADHLLAIEGEGLSGAIACGTDTVFIDRCVTTGTFALIASGLHNYAWQSSTIGIDSINSDSVNIAQPIGAHTIILSGADTNTNATDTIVIRVNIFALPDFTVTSTAAADAHFICQGTSATITVTTVGTNSIVWSPAFGLDTTAGPVVIASPDTNTTYTITVTTENGCVKTTTQAINIGTIYPTVSVDAPVTEVCPGDSVTLEGKAVGGATGWLWYPAATLSSATTQIVKAGPLATTTYSVVGTRLGCKDTATVTVTVRPVPVMSYTQSSGGNAIKLDEVDVITLTCPTCEYYHWKLPNSQLYSASNVQRVSPDVPGSNLIHITGFDATDCKNTITVTVNVDSAFAGEPWTPLGVNELANNEIRVAQNDEAILVSAGAPIVSCKVFDLLGSQVASRENINSSTLSIDASALNSGIYIVTVNSSAATHSTKVFVR